MIRFALAGGKPQALAILSALETHGHVPAMIVEASGLPAADRDALHRWADTHDIPIATTLAPDLLASLDVLLLCRYQLVPERIFSAPRLGTLNVHSSLLPKYRGVHPISWALVEGAAETGVTVHVVDAGIDTGSIVAQNAITILDDHDLHSLTACLDDLSASVVAEVFQTIAVTGRLPAGRPQSGPASPAPRRGPDDGRIDWSGPGRGVYNLVRALPAPLPPAFTYSMGRRIDVEQCALVDAIARRPAGTVLVADEATAQIQCGDGTLVAIATSEPLAVGSVLL